MSSWELEVARESYGSGLRRNEEENGKLHGDGTEEGKNEWMYSSVITEAPCIELKW